MCVGALLGFPPVLAPERRAELDAIVAACAAGGLSPNVALMRLLMLTPSAEAVERSLECRSENGSGPLPALRVLFAAHRHSWSRLRSILDAVRHDRAQSPADLATAFDRAAAISPEAAVALYSLGDPKLLAEATAEIIAKLRQWEILRPERCVIDLGCGIGRLVPALAAESAYVLGLELSPRMLEVARARCAALANIGFLHVGGNALAAVAAASADLILAVDSFPYLLQSAADAGERQIGEAARALRRGGDLVIFNLSYRGDLERDRRDIAGWAEAAGLAVLRNGTRDLRHWDGVAFHLRKITARGTNTVETPSF